MSDPKMTLPSGGGAYERLADGSLKQVEKPTAWAAPAEALEAPVEGPVKASPKRTVRED